MQLDSSCASFASGARPLQAPSHLGSQGNMLTVTCVVLQEKQPSNLEATRGGVAGGSVAFRIV